MLSPLFRVIFISLTFVSSYHSFFVPSLFLSQLFPSVDDNSILYISPYFSFYSPELIFLSCFQLVFSSMSIWYHDALYCLSCWPYFCARFIIHCSCSLFRIPMSRWQLKNALLSIYSLFYALISECCRFYLFKCRAISHYYPTSKNAVKIFMKNVMCCVKSSSECQINVVWPLNH